MYLNTKNMENIFNLSVQYLEKYSSTFSWHTGAGTPIHIFEILRFESSNVGHLLYAAG